MSFVFLLLHPLPPLLQFILRSCPSPTTVVCICTCIFKTASSKTHHLISNCYFLLLGLCSSISPPLLFSWRKTVSTRHWIIDTDRLARIGTEPGAPATAWGGTGLFIIDQDGAESAWWVSANLSPKFRFLRKTQLFIIYQKWLIQRSQMMQNAIL